GQATSFANANIAFIKYWGNRDHALRLPVNSSLSMNLGGLFTRTTVTFASAFTADAVVLDNAALSPEASRRVVEHLDRVRALANTATRARVDSHNNFPTGAGIASSASGFAALTVAACAAAGLRLSERELSVLARQGSGSASRSIAAGFVEWQAGTGSDDSYAFSIAGPEHWALVDCIAIVSDEHKAVGSTGGHAIAHTSPLQTARIEDTLRRLGLCREALLARDFPRFAEVVEEDSTMMHAVMMTSRPPLYYWQPPTLAIMEAVRGWRAGGLPVCFTIDAGPNVHVITLAAHAAEVESRLRALPGVQNVLRAAPGGGAELLSS
ncbi:MAG: diphosphomevalonate decarboxylase, partial [Chloroflexi bacterium]|nr:diphosphomevalonate decarboxylase [Chloroflexota bacterium]